ncbi:hypothetical protein BC351_10520 [Paenibacillus ferrarius]|uniref:Uncharacterized protein n=1 Tax=Paenibacillus ferrarius TaxID=1469647 RepID=A0A1V4H8S1_9BACL|nr:hypothetical protein [Paenibacillus ferrarius]OPH47615.1 hypothetical protein BC351_10520 [Paenibacillus ferrarius]
MKEPKNKSIPLLFQKINHYDSVEDDVRFLKVKIWLMHLGENLNGSYFAKEVVEAAVPTLSNTPILAYIEDNSEGNEDFSDHRQALIKKDGKYAVKYLGSPIGVIPSDNNAQFEDRLCDDGITRSFLTVEGLVWRKFDDPVDILNRDLIKAESMELADNYEGEFKEDGLFHFTKFSFFGACGLGSDVKPAMQNATIEVQFSEVEFSKLVNEKIELFKRIYSAKGGKELVNKEFTWSSEQLEDELRRIVRQNKKTDSWGYEYCDEYLVDFLPEEKVVIVFNYEKSTYLGYEYSVIGDVVSINYESQSRYKDEWKKMSLPQEGDTEETIDFNFVPSEVMEYSLKVKEAELRKEFETAKECAVSELQEKLLDMNNKYSELENNFTQLKEFKDQYENQEKQSKIKEAFRRFSNVLDKDELDLFKEKSNNCENVDDFIKDLKSFACDKLLAKTNDNKGGHMFVGIHVDGNPSDEIDKSNVWSRLKSKNNN